MFVTQVHMSTCYGVGTVNSGMHRHMCCVCMDVCYVCMDVCCVCMDMCYVCMDVCSVCIDMCYVCMDVCYMYVWALIPNLFTC